MNANTDSAEHTSASSPRMWKLALGCVGVVYGDIGTSPLYAFREAALRVAGEDGIMQTEIYGVLSLILWTLIISVTLKYVLFLLRMDNRGEGGSLSLMALAKKAIGPQRVRIVFFLGILAASLFYGEAAITPAISVLSAVEGLKLVNPGFSEFVLPISIFILIMLFMMQKYGTGKVSVLFGPITLLWFLVIGGIGLMWVIRDPQILFSANPAYGISFLIHHGKVSFVVLGAVFLVVTGTEALYVDLGHFGRKPIQMAWIWLVFPCLALNYLGQGALVLEHPEAVHNTFYMMVPEWGLIPIIILATMATIIASQAVITGAYSMAQQATHFGLLPRLEVRHTSTEQEGQIYMPKVNRVLLLTVVLLCVMFRSSDALAAAYGIAVNGTMILTSILAFIVIWKAWKKHLLLAIAVVLPFLTLECVFLWSNLLKLHDGGIVPLILASILVTMMTTWIRGTRILYQRAHRKTVSLGDLIETLDRNPPVRIDGTAIFLTSDPHVAPMALLHNLKHNKILHSHNIILTVVTMHTPTVPDEQQVMAEHLSSSMTRIIVHFGYMETPDVPRALMLARKRGLDINLQDATYFLGRRSVVSSSANRLQEELVHAWQQGVNEKKKRIRLPGRKKPQYTPVSYRGLPEWQDHIYVAMTHSGVAATDFYRIPRNQVVEMGIQVAV